MIMIDAIAVSAIFTYLAKQKLQSHQEERFFKWVQGINNVYKQFNDLSTEVPPFS